MKCSIGIFAYNEEKNIKTLIQSLLGQELDNVEIGEVLVFTDGSTDKTESIARSFRDKRIRVFGGEKRLGKSEAINIFLRESNHNILVMESGDTVPEKDALEKIVLPLFKQGIGMVGGRPVPKDGRIDFMGFTTNLIWDLHHRISLESPKMGEMVAFKKIISAIPKTAVDEAFIEYLIKKKGQKVVYEPEAVVYNKGAKTISDYMRQRRRIHCGHLILKKEASYNVSTTGNVLGLVVKIVEPNFKNILFASGAIVLEGFARILGWWDFKRGKSHEIWDIAETTK